MKESNIMHKQTQSISNDIDILADDARALMAATADTAGDRIADARERLGAALEAGKEVISRIKDKGVQGVKATDQAVRENPYQAIGIALGAGVLIGYLVGR